MKVRRAHPSRLLRRRRVASYFWHSGHQYAVRAWSPCGAERTDGAAARAGAAGAPVDVARRARSRSTRRAHQPVRRLEHRPQLVVGDARRAGATARRALPRAPRPARCSRSPPRDAGRGARRRPRAPAARHAAARASSRSRAPRRGCPGRDAREAAVRARARPVPEHGLVLARRAARATASHAGRAAGLDAPATVHPQVAAQDEAAVEAEEEVLPDRLHPLEPPAVEPLGEPLHRGARVRGLDLDSLADENLQPLRRAVERIAFRHPGKPTIRACPGPSSASAGGSGVAFARRRRDVDGDRRRAVLGSLGERVPPSRREASRSPTRSGGAEGRTPRSLDRVAASCRERPPRLLGPLERRRRRHRSSGTP